MEGFQIKLPIQLRYSDFDMLRHLNSAQYSTFLELGRLEYFKQLEWNLNDVSNVVASFTINFMNQIIPTDKVVVWIKVAQLGNKSFKMEYILASEDEKYIYAKAETTQVCILKKDNSSTPIPAAIRKSIAEFEDL